MVRIEYRPPNRSSVLENSECFLICAPFVIVAVIVEIDAEKADGLRMLVYVCVRVRVGGWPARRSGRATNQTTS